MIETDRRFIEWSLLCVADRTVPLPSCAMQSPSVLPGEPNAADTRNLQQLRDKFKAMDRNADGKLSEEELISMLTDSGMESDAHTHRQSSELSNSLIPSAHFAPLVPLVCSLQCYLRFQARLHSLRALRCRHHSSLLRPLRRLLLGSLRHASVRRELRVVCRGVCAHVALQSSQGHPSQIQRCRHGQTTYTHGSRGAFGGEQGLDRRCELT